MYTFAAMLIVPWLVCMALTPLLIRVATQRGWLDQPGGRKGHRQPVPLLGGVAVFAAIGLGLAALAAVEPAIRERAWGPGSLGWMGLGVVAMVALGLYDDLRDMRPIHKLGLQIVIAAATWLLGFRAPGDSLWIDPTGLSEDLASFAVTVAWLVIVTNAFNLIDGMDGLASGIAIIAALTVFLLANSAGASVPVIAALALSGSLAAFLRFNLPPARIFLGDSGSMAIGYMTALLALASFQRAPTGLALIVPLLVLGLPMIDTVAAILRRGIAYMRRADAEPFNPLEIARAVFQADRGHIHHLLQRRGLSVQQSLLVLYGLSAGLAALGFWSRSASFGATWVLWLALLALGFVALRLLERSVLRLEAQREAESEAAADLETDAVAQPRQRAAG